MDKPPLGLVPRRMVELNRLAQINGAIDRYIAAHKQVPDEWLEEYTDIVQRWSFEDGREDTNDIPVNTEAVNDAPVESRASRYARYLDELYVRRLLTPEKYFKMMNNPERFSSEINTLREDHGLK